MRRVPVPVVPAWLRWAGVIALAAVIFYLSVVAAPPEDPVLAPPEIIPLDKWRHFLAYAALAGGLAYATVDWDRPAVHLAILVVGVAALYGIGIEAAQATVPERYFSLGDAWANVLGAVLVLPWFALRQRMRLVPLGVAGSEG